MNAEVVVHDVAGSILATVDAPSQHEAMRTAHRLMFAARAVFDEGVRAVLRRSRSGDGCVVEFVATRPVFPRELKGVVESLVARAMGG